MQATTTQKPAHASIQRRQVCTPKVVLPPTAAGRQLRLEIENAQLQTHIYHRPMTDSACDAGCQAHCSLKFEASNDAACLRHMDASSSMHRHPVSKCDQLCHGIAP